MANLFFNKFFSIFQFWGCNPTLVLYHIISQWVSPFQCNIADYIEDLVEVEINCTTIQHLCKSYFFHHKEFKCKIWSGGKNHQIFKIWSMWNLHWSCCPPKNKTIRPKNLKVDDKKHEVEKKENSDNILNYENNFLCKKLYLK